MYKTLYCITLLTLFTNIKAQEWNLQDEIAPIAASESDFGVNMVFADDMLVVAWPRIFTRDNDPDNCGEIITYNKVNGNYEELSRLTAADLTGDCTNGDGFGFGLAYDDGTLAIGMPAGVRAGMGMSGGMTDSDSKVFLTTFENDNWVLHETLSASDLGTGKGMGFQLVLEDDLLLVHAHEYDTIFGFSFPISTGVYVFENSGSGFVETQKLEEDFHLFGQDFDYENNQIIVGAWGEQALTQPGRIYIYENTGSNWSIVQTINDTRNSNLGNQIEIFDNTMAAGNVQAGGTGAVTLFNKDNNGTWNEIQFIQASDKAFNDQFGIAVRLDEDELIVGAGAGQDATQTLGAVYTFKKESSGLFIEDQKLVASNPTNLHDRFAGNLIFNDTDMLVSSTSGGFNNGDMTSYHHFTRNSTIGNTPKYNVNSKVSGTWKTAASDNQNINLEILRNGKAVIYAKLNNNADNFWLLGVGEVSNNTIDFSDLYSTSGAMFGENFNTNDVVLSNIGQAQLSFSLCDEAVLTYDLTNIETNEISLTKDKEIPGNECSNNTKILPNGVSGAWYDPTRSGEGVTVYLFEDNAEQMASVTWYTYDNNGNQLWSTGIGTVNNQTINITEMNQYTGAELFSGTTQKSNLGTFSMTWNECHKAIVDYDFSLAGLDSGQLTLNQLTILDNTLCDLQK